MHVPRCSRNLERLAAVIALEQRDRLRGSAPFIKQASESKTSVGAECDFCLHIGKFFLNQLICRKGSAELFPLQGVVARSVPAKISRAHRAPRDSVTRAIKAAEGALQTADFGEDILSWHENILHDDLTRHRGSQRKLSLNGGRAESFLLPLQNKPADHTFIIFRPTDKDIRDRRIGDPHLGPADPVAAINRPGPGLHAAGV